MDLQGEKLILTMFQIFFIGIILYILYFRDDRLAYFLLSLILVISLWKQYIIHKHKSLCSLSKKLYCK